MNKIKNKIISNLTTDGKKSKGEKTLIKSIKELQKDSKKQTKKLIQTTLILSSPIFKLHTLKKKKTKKKHKAKLIPVFISNQKRRISLAIKFILSNTNKKQNLKFYKQLKEKIITTSQQKGNIIETKNHFQKQVIIYKHFLKYYKWN